jgi:hypothetical protein
VKIREVLSDKSKWCQGNAALTPEGKSVEPSDPKASKWCFFGAALKCYGKHDQLVWNDTLDKIHDYIRKHYNGTSMIVFNDSHTYEEVKAISETLDV